MRRPGDRARATLGSAGHSAVPPAPCSGSPVFELARRFSAPKLVAMALNVAILAYLLWRRLSEWRGGGARDAGRGGLVRRHKPVVRTWASRGSVGRCRENSLVEMGEQLLCVIGGRHDGWICAGRAAVAASTPAQRRRGRRGPRRCPGPP